MDRRAPHFAISLISLLSLPVGAAPGPVLQTPEARVHAVVERPLSGDPATTRLGFFFELQPHWHIYWKNPGDSGLAPTVEWLEGGDAYDFAGFEWPAPRRITLSTLANYGYENEVLLPLRATARAGKGGKIRAKLSWLVCKEECIPREGELTFDPAAAGPLTVHFPTKGIPAMDGSWKRLAAEGDRLVAALEIPVAPAELDAAELDFFPEEPGLVRAYPRPKAAVAPAGQGSRVTFRFEKKTWPPGKKIAALPGLLFTGKDRAFAIGLAAGAVAAPAPVEAAPAPDYGWLLLFALCGGMLLNLMPCVFPILALKVFDFSRHAADDTREIRVESAVYAAGVLTSFWALAGALLLLRWQGHQLGWGFQLQSPAFVLALATLFFAMALNFWGLFEIRVALSGRTLARAQEGRLGAFFGGLLTTVVSTPCTAPFLGAALGASLVLSPLRALGIFTAMGIGVALPYVLLVNTPALRRRLPRPGAWMDRLKGFLGFLMMATVVWLLWVLAEQNGLAALVIAMFGLLILACGLWWPGRGRAFARVGAILVAAPLLWAAGSAARGATGWENFDPAQLEAYASADRPTLIDFTASWCLTCQVNKAVALENAGVRAALAEAKVRLVRADWTHKDDAITRALASFGRSSVPTNVIVGPRGRPPVLLPTVLTPGMVSRAVRDRNPGGQP